MPHIRLQYITGRRRGPAPPTHDPALPRVDCRLWRLLRRCRKPPSPRSDGGHEGDRVSYYGTEGRREERCVITLRGMNRILCDGFSRRDLLQIGGLGALGLSLSQYLRLEVAA